MIWDLQSPDETLDWRNDWTDWLNDGDDIVSSVWLISPDATLAEDTIDTNGQVTIVIVSGLTIGKSYELQNNITTNAGLTGSRSITIRCSHR